MVINQTEKAPKLKNIQLLRKSLFIFLMFAILILTNVIRTDTAHADTQTVTITYLSYNGKSNDKFEAMKQVVYKGANIRIPSVPSVKNYQSMGWSLTKASSNANYTPGMVVTASKNMTLYAAYKLLPCQVVFTNNSGNTQNTKFSDLNRRVAKNATIKLPELPSYSGYANIGWATTAGATSANYKVGDTVRITGNTKFYGVYKKASYCTVAFYYGNGTYDSSYIALKKKVVKGSTITLPAVPKRSGYYNYGWSTTMNASKALGATYKVTANTKLYAVQKKAVGIYLKNNAGVAYKTIVVGAGDSVILPTANDSATHTFIGWSTSPGQSVNPTYQAGQAVSFSKSINLYMVAFRKSTEREFGEANIYKLDTNKYKRAIFIGDSRTNRMRNTLQNEFGSASYPNVTFIAEEGMGLSWFQNTGYQKLLSNIKTYGAGTASKPIAIIFNLGVNDMGNINYYVSAMKSLTNELAKYNCKFFYMSINPINSRVINSRSSVNNRTEYKVRAFNTKIRSGLAGTFTYIDTYSHLMRNGFVYDSGNGYLSGIDDGLHYSPNTYKRIFDVAITKVNAS